MSLVAPIAGTGLRGLITNLPKTLIGVSPAFARIITVGGQAAARTARAAQTAATATAPKISRFGSISKGSIAVTAASTAAGIGFITAITPLTTPEGGTTTAIQEITKSAAEVSENLGSVLEPIAKAIGQNAGLLLLLGGGIILVMLVK